MLKSSTKDEGVMATPSAFADGLRSSMCFQAVLGFFFNKGVRGGPRVLLNLAAVLVGLFIFVKLLPTRMTESALQRIPLPKTVWSGLSNAVSRPGGLRIVVFGELDIGTPVGANPEDEDSKSWTEMLCDQLECDTHITMVPPPDTTPWSISSNEIYAQGIDRVFNETDGQKGPGQDYSHLSRYYPAQWKSRDLKAQIDEFLALPKGKTPQRTIWIFSFGFWDVWSLSALPVAQGKQSVELMTRDVFEQVERLYAASLDPTSIAYSHTTVLKKAPIEASNNSSKSVEQAPPVENQPTAGEKAPVEELEAPAPAETATQSATPGSTTIEEEDLKDPGKFEVLVPRVVDPSLLPGWRDLRPRIPSVHSKAEQMRNSAILTLEWNDRIADRMIDWVHKEEAEKSGDFYIDTGIEAPARPARDGFAYNLAEFVMDKILERQMVNAHLKDGNGRGDSEIDEGYRDVRNPCLQPVDASRVSIPGPVVGDVMLNIPNDKIENDLQTPRKPPSGGPAKRAEFENKPGLAYLATAKVCNIPDDHLFYTPFALSQRAIWGIANETSDLILNGESVRTKLGKKE